MRACVVDASVGIKLFVQEDLSDQADRLFSQLAEDPGARFYVPDLFFVECTNILWKYARNYAYPAESARRDVEDLGALALVSVSTADLIVSALDLALDFGVTAYDGCYAALAQLLDLPLVTADIPLSRKLEGSEVKVRLLEDLFLE
jgi:predicted nucleic acid-binding protein